MTDDASCGTCRHFIGQALALEREITGLGILSSALGSVRADTGWCRERDVFRTPDHTCSDWLASAWRRRGEPG